MDFKTIFNYSSVDECIAVLQFAYTLREALKAAPNSVRSVVSYRALDKEIFEAEKWIENQPSYQLSFESKNV